jgi:hypothetical protein
MKEGPVTEEITILFPDWYDDRAELESPAKGHLTGVRVQLADGATYSLSFYDPVRLQQTIEDDAKAGRPFFAQIGLVVLPEVTTNAIRWAIRELWQEGFFRHLRPLP